MPLDAHFHLAAQLAVDLEVLDLEFVPTVLLCVDKLVRNRSLLENCLGIRPHRRESMRDALVETLVCRARFLEMKRVVRGDRLWSVVWLHFINV